MADKKDFYEVLGVQKGCTDDQLKKAYRDLAKKYHPDLNPEDKNAEKMFKEINEAYEMLSDKDKRTRYDQYGHAGVDPSFAGAGGFGGGAGFGFDDIGDIFDSFFGGGFGSFGGSARTRNPNAPIRGNDVNISLPLTFMEAALGTQKEISMQHLEACDECSGSGAKIGTAPETCPECNGSGQVKVQQRTPFGVVQSVKPCQRCGGKGVVIKNPCTKCKGMGRVRVTKRIEVTIPAGIDDGQTYVVRGQGDQGVNNGPAGDLNVLVTVRPDPLFERDGFDVWCDIPITYVQAVLGDEIVVPTIDGKVKYDVPEGTQSGTVFRLRNKGIAYVNGKGRGDQYVKANIEVPKNLSSKQRDMLRDFDKQLGDKNYEKRKNFFDKLKDRMGNS